MGSWLRGLLALLLVTYAIAVLAFEHSYSVKGNDGDGNTFEGFLFGQYGDRNVSGNITDQHGDAHSFYGKLMGEDRINGETDDGDKVFLYIK